MINLEQFWADPKHNVELLNDWRKARRMDPVLSVELPDLGLMVFDEHMPIAAGFLRNAEGLGFIDSVVSNPIAPAKARDEALNVIFERLIAIAKMMGMTRLMGTSVDDHTIERSKKFGFIQSDQTVMIKSLGGM